MKIAWILQYYPHKLVWETRCISKTCRSWCLTIWHPFGFIRFCFLCALLLLFLADRIYVFAFYILHAHPYNDYRQSKSGEYNQDMQAWLMKLGNENGQTKSFPCIDTHAVYRICILIKSTTFSLRSDALLNQIILSLNVFMWRFTNGSLSISLLLFN